MGPVLLSLDGELQENPIPNRQALHIPKFVKVVPPIADTGALAEAAKMLVAAENPVSAHSRFGDLGPSRGAGRLKPAPGIRRFPLSLRPSFVHRLASTIIPRCVGTVARQCTAMEVGWSSAPGVLARVRVVLSRPVIT